MALTIGGGGGGAAGTLYGRTTTFNHGGDRFLRRPILLPPSNPLFWSLQSTSRNDNNNIVPKAAKKMSSRTGKFDSKNKRSLNTTTKEQETEQGEQQQRTVQIETDGSSGGTGVVDGVGGDDGYFLPELPGLEQDFWEGPQWDTFGFVVQYLWAFGILFAVCGVVVVMVVVVGAAVAANDSRVVVLAMLIACGIAVATYNEGATDFKATPAYKESIQSRELLEEPEGSNSDVFESNPTEEAPSLE
ncbi:hypothetical protein TEA_015498 [Camellia sinensis var. sinensis]|uniref:Uncharacterized protein n=1 Tax=Camellia sinensis var. sinensis TaxID=542762 RepID=A0A4V3WLC1_CAMSN|nr:hypothetical protein TEA_015498 [Camellia sinensis var. sinensis]